MLLFVRSNLLLPSSVLRCAYLLDSSLTGSSKSGNAAESLMGSAEAFENFVKKHRESRTIREDVEPITQISNAEPTQTQESINTESKLLPRRLKNSLNVRHRILAEGGIPPAIYEHERYKWELGERFGQFGLASGVNPSHLWPTVEEIEEINDLKMYRRAIEAIKITENTKQKESERVMARKLELKRNLDLYTKQLEEFEARLMQKESNLTEQEEKTQRRIREIQEYFGYWIDPKDPRFEVMLKQKETEEKKAAKRANKEAKKMKEIVS